MSIHVAILKPVYIDLILRGRKTIESRLTHTAMPPYRAIKPGELIFLKRSGGPFAAIARAGRVDFFDDLTPGGVERLRKRFDARVLGDADHWKDKAGSRYATFVELKDVEPCDVGPTYAKSMRAWHVLDEAHSPLVEVTLRGGAIRNRYVTLPHVSDRMRSSPFTLLLPDGERVETDIAKGNMIRWRGWGAYYQRHGMRAGDRVRFVALGGRRYRVSFHTASRRAGT